MPGTAFLSRLAMTSSSAATLGARSVVGVLGVAIVAQVAWLAVRFHAIDGRVGGSATLPTAFTASVEARTASATSLEAFAARSSLAVSVQTVRRSDTADAANI